MLVSQPISEDVLREKYSKTQDEDEDLILKQMQFALEDFFDNIYIYKIPSIYLYMYIFKYLY